MHEKTQPCGAVLHASMGEVEPGGPARSGACRTWRACTPIRRHTAEEGEVYVGMEGTGVLLLFDGEETRPVDLAPGLAAYIPPGWAHRTVNTGDEPFRFLAVYPGAAGHDYEMVLRDGMGARVMQDAGGYTLRPAANGEESRA